MSIKWFGAVLIIAGCGGFGFSMSASHRRTEYLLRRLISALDYMECELQFHMTALPELCRQAGKESSGCIQSILYALSSELEAKRSPDVVCCMNSVLAATQNIPETLMPILVQLGASLGRFDLNGQLKGLDAVRANCRKKLAALEQNRETRMRSYQTLGLCAGAALAILFI